VIEMRGVIRPCPCFARTALLDDDAGPVPTSHPIDADRSFSSLYPPIVTASGPFNPEMVSVTAFVAVSITLTVVEPEFAM
jgi:hypothetical protein